MPRCCLCPTVFILQWQVYSITIINFMDMHGIGSLLANWVIWSRNILHFLERVCLLARSKNLRTAVLSTNSFCHIHCIIFLSSTLACFNALIFRFLCEFSYHACYLLCPPHPTQDDYAKIWWLSRKSSPSAWGVSKWLKPCHCIQVVHIWFSCTSISSVFVSHCCYSAPAAADGSPFLCAVLLFQALHYITLLLFWALWFLFIFY
jgi:hypothetical protein